MNSLSQNATAGERRVINALVTHILSGENLISVCDGEEWTVKRSTNKREILDALATTDNDVIRVRCPLTGDVRGSFNLIYGNAEDGCEVIADHTANEYCDFAYSRATRAR